MNKTAIKNFAIWARNKLIADVSYDARLIGITEDGIAKPLPQSFGGTQFFDIGTAEPYSISGEAVRQRDKLIEVIQQKEKDTDYKTAYQYVIEEVAYTWFNRLIAIRFMEVNDYLPSHIRVLSSESGKLEPDLVTTPFDAELPFTAEEEAQIFQLKQDNKLDEVFRILFLKQCNALNEILPALFEKTKNYTELLLSLSVIDQDGVVYHLIHDIPEDDFNIERGGQVEIIGWLYQYYNTEPKAAAFAKNGKITKEEIPAVTQLFTPDWIVRYMVENSLGRLWVEGHPDCGLKENWKYYLEEAQQEPEVQAKLAEIRKEYAALTPEDIKLIDPCMGSGHILVYAFDVLMQIYESAGYSQRDAAKSILENNIYGLDIDDRAYQLAYFAVMMKARQYNRRILNGENSCHVYAIQESNSINRAHLKYFGAGMDDIEKNAAKMQMEGLLDTLTDAKEYGSILNVESYNWDLLRRFVAAEDTDGQISIPGIPVAYWANQTIINAFRDNDSIRKVANPRLGFATGDNETFMRTWFEPSIRNIGFGYESREKAKESGLKWFPTNKGGSYRKWYGNLELVVDWQNDGQRIRNFKDANGKLRSRPQNLKECFSDGITWTVICNHSSFRYSPIGMLYNNKGPILGHRQSESNFYVLGYLNSKVAEYILQILSPTLGFESGYVSNLPYAADTESNAMIFNIVESCIGESKMDWDSFETSWDFKKHPLFRDVSTISEAFTQWQSECDNRFNQLKANEEELNRIFIDIYGLQDELTPEVEDKDVTVRKADLQRDIKSLLSYAVGCMFGRYSTYKDGLLFAGEPYSLQAFVDKLNERPGTISAEELQRAYRNEGVVVDEMFFPDEDNVIPITDEEYLDDDIVSRLCAWLKAVYGADTLEENLDYIAKALGNKGSTSREIIRNYFLNDFFKDHCQTYSVTGSGKRPIYWLFDSGKQNGFKALVYLHRYTPDTIGNLRIDYLHKMQRVYESEINRMQDMMDHSGNAREVAAASKRKDKLAKQLKECREYDEKISHLALSRTELDLDDGVKVNYRKLQTAQDGKFYEVLADSKNIMVKEKK